MLGTTQIFMHASNENREGGNFVTELLMKGARISSPQKEGASNKLLFPTAFIGKPNDREDDGKWMLEKRSTVLAVCLPRRGISRHKTRSSYDLGPQGMSGNT